MRLPTKNEIQRPKNGFLEYRNPKLLKTRTKQEKNTKRALLIKQAVSVGVIALICVAAFLYGAHSNQSEHQMTHFGSLRKSERKITHLKKVINRVGEKQHKVTRTVSSTDQTNTLTQTEANDMPPYIIEPSSNHSSSKKKKNKGKTKSKPAKNKKKSSKNTRKSTPKKKNSSQKKETEKKPTTKKEDKKDDSVKLNTNLDSGTSKSGKNSEDSTSSYKAAYEAAYKSVYKAAYQAALKSAEDEINDETSETSNKDAFKKAIRESKTTKKDKKKQVRSKKSAKKKNKEEDTTELGAKTGGKKRTKKTKKNPKTSKYERLIVGDNTDFESPESTDTVSADEYRLVFYGFQCNNVFCNEKFRGEDVDPLQFEDGLTISIPSIGVKPTKIAYGNGYGWAEARFRHKNLGKVLVVINWASDVVKGGLQGSVLLDVKKMTDKSLHTFEIAVYRSFLDDSISAKLLPPKKGTDDGEEGDHLWWD